jgi:hypothetical protein
VGLRNQYARHRCKPERTAARKTDHPVPQEATTPMNRRMPTLTPWQTKHPKQTYFRTSPIAFRRTEYPVTEVVRKRWLPQRIRELQSDDKRSFNYQRFYDEAGRRYCRVLIGQPELQNPTLPG